MIMRLAILAAVLVLSSACKTVPECASLPTGAVTAIPEPFDRYAAFKCSEYGQAIFAKKPDFWAYPYVGTPIVVVPFDPDALDDPGANRYGYFTELYAGAPDPDDVGWINEKRQMLRIDEPDQLIALYAKTSLGTSPALFLGLKDGEARPMFGLWCKGPCTDFPVSVVGHPFVVTDAPN